MRCVSVSSRGTLTAPERLRRLERSGDGVPPQLPHQLMTPVACSMARWERTRRATGTT